MEANEDNEIFKISKYKLCNFLILAKKNTYAANAKKAKSKCILSKNYIFSNNDFRYEDQYFGKYLDVGNEIVWYKDIPVWGMGYRGGMIRKYVDLHEETFAFLRKALMSPPIDFPARGPCELVHNDLIYLNNYKGDILSFVGEEIILKNQTKVYFRNYIGGLIFDKTSNNVWGL